MPAPNSPGLGWRDYTPTVVGIASPTINEARYIDLGNLVFVKISVGGTSNGSTFTVTVPIPSLNFSFNPFDTCQATDNGGNVISRFYFASASVIQIDKNNLGPSNGWTASGTKAVSLAFFYEI